MKFDTIVIGCGFSGSVISRELADRLGHRVLIIDKRNHIAGNMYDKYDENGVLIHKYGPHIFHTNSDRVFNYLSTYTKWNDYTHKVKANIYGNYLPVPFNLQSIKNAFPQEANQIIELVSKFGAKCTILDLEKEGNPLIQKLCDYIIKNIFSYYTKKQWGEDINNVSKATLQRVPIYFTHDDKYFQDKYQGLPLYGYTRLFENLLNHPNICVKLNTDCKTVLTVTDNEILYNNEKFTGTVIYTGPIDELFNYQYGSLNYRTLDFAFETYDMEYYQQCGTVNYTVDKEYTRITEFKHLTQQLSKNTTILKEYPRDYNKLTNDIPFYPIQNDKNMLLYKQYYKKTEQHSNLHVLGRLGEYKYYNMDQIVLKALLLSDYFCRKKEVE